MAAQVEKIANDSATHGLEKSHTYGEINPFDPKINIIVLNGDILPTVSSVQVPGLRPRRKIASLPGRFVTLPIPDKLEGDFLPPDDMNPGTIVTAVPMDNEYSVSPHNAGEKSIKISPRGVTPRGTTPRISPRIGSSTVNNQSSIQNGVTSPRAGAASSPIRKLATPRHNATHTVTVGGKQISPRLGTADDDHEESALPFDNNNTTNQTGGMIATGDAEAKDDNSYEEKNLVSAGALYNKFDLRIETKPFHNPDASNTNNAISSSSNGSGAYSLEELVQEKLEYLDQVYNSMFRLYAWANMPDGERRISKDRPTVTYEETVTRIRDMVNWNEFASKKKYATTAMDEKEIIRPVYMKILTLLMVHASIATGCDMNDVVKWHGHNVGYCIGKYVWTMAELQSAVDDSFAAPSVGATTAAAST